MDKKYKKISKHKRNNIFIEMVENLKVFFPTGYIPMI